MLVQVKSPFCYAQKMRAVGDKIDMPESDARVMGLMDKVERLEPRRGRPPKHGRYSRRDMRAEN